MKTPMEVAQVSAPTIAWNSYAHNETTDANDPRALAVPNQRHDDVSEGPLAVGDVFVDGSATSKSIAAEAALTKEEQARVATAEADRRCRRGFSPDAFWFRHIFWFRHQSKNIAAEAAPTKAWRARSLGRFDRRIIALFVIAGWVA